MIFALYIIIRVLLIFKTLFVVKCTFADIFLRDMAI